MAEQCKKCKGIGTIERYGHVADGICFKCYGTGGTDPIAIKWAKDYTIGLTQAAYHTLHNFKPQTKEEIINDLKIVVARLYHKILENKYPSITEHRKQDARNYYNELLSLGYKMTKQEMESMTLDVVGR